MNSKLEQLKDGFPSFLREKNECTCGRILKYDALSSSHLASGFLAGRDHKRNSMVMGIMFTGAVVRVSLQYAVEVLMTILITPIVFITQSGGVNPWRMAIRHLLKCLHWL